jgi:hypothetical protein
MLVVIFSSSSSSRVEKQSRAEQREEAEKKQKVLTAALDHCSVAHAYFLQGVLQQANVVISKYTIS